MAEIIGLVGLPGSGKSTLIAKYKEKGFACFDGIRANDGWHPNIVEASRLYLCGKDMLIADIDFCRQHRRTELQAAMPAPVRWIYFENNPLQCAANCIYRAMHDRSDTRTVWDCIASVRELRKCYRPPMDALKVENAWARFPQSESR